MAAEWILQYKHIFTSFIHLKNMHQEVCHYSDATLKEPCLIKFIFPVRVHLQCQ